MTVVDGQIAPLLAPVVLERTFAAPRDLVFSLFTDPKHLVRWWIPYPLTLQVNAFEFKQGGTVDLVMRTANGRGYPALGKVIEIDPPRRIVFSAQQDMNAESVPQTNVIQAITFSEREQQTTIRVEITVIEFGPTTTETIAGAASGWMQDFGRLHFYLLNWPIGDLEPEPVVTTPSDREIVVSRIFHAPREQVFTALTDSEALPVWWGTNGATTHVEQMDLWQDGQWRIVQQAADGNVTAFHGHYLLVDAPELLAETFAVEGSAESTIEAIHLVQQGEVTRMTSISLFPSRTERDRALDAGLPDQLLATYERLNQSLQ